MKIGRLLLKPTGQIDSSTHLLVHYQFQSHPLMQLYPLSTSLSNTNSVVPHDTQYHKNNFTFAKQASICRTIYPIEIDRDRERKKYVFNIHSLKWARNYSISISSRIERVSLSVSLSLSISLTLRFQFCAHILSLSLSLSFTYTNFMRIVPISKALSQRKSKIEWTMNWS